MQINVTNIFINYVNDFLLMLNLQSLKQDSLESKHYSF